MLCAGSPGVWREYLCSEELRGYQFIPNLRVIINLMFTLYHLYLRSNCDYQHRLLNILFCHLAITLQFGSLINILNIVRSLGLDISSIKTPLFSKLLNFIYLFIIYKSMIRFPFSLY